jgi:NitT/TauT family transport system substrate-binding protein
MMRTRVTLGLVVLVAMVMLLVPGAGAQQRDKVVLMLNWYNYGEHAPLYLGLARGYYAEEGIDLEIQEGRGSGTTIQAVAAGSATLGYADMGTMIKTIAKGAPVKAVGVLIQTSPMAVMGLADKNIREPKDLLGKTIALTPGDAVGQIFLAFLKATGIKEEQFKSVTGDATTKRNAVIMGRADLLTGHVNDQQITIEEATGKKVHSIKFADYGVNPVNNGIIVRKDLLAAKPDLLRRFMRAATKSVEAGAKEPEAALEALLKVNPKAGKIEVLREGLKQTIPLLHSKYTQGQRPWRAAAEDMKVTLDLMVEYGGVDPAAKGKPDDYYTNELLP